MTLLRFLILLSLAIWLGALIFFPVVAQTSFTVLPSAHLAGLVVRNSLIDLHWMGIVCRNYFSGLFADLQPRNDRKTPRLRSEPHSGDRHAGAHGDFAVRDYSAHGCAANISWRNFSASCEQSHSRAIRFSARLVDSHRDGRPCARTGRALLSRPSFFNFAVVALNLSNIEISLWLFLCETQCSLWLSQKLEPERTQSFTEESRASEANPLEAGGRASS